MLRRLREARLVFPALMTIAGLAVLVGLGSWQWQRKSWKEGLIARITERSHGAPVPIEQVLAAYTSSKGDIEYTNVVAEGRYLHDRERYFYAPASGNPGWHVLTPLVIDGGRAVWINRGFVPDAARDPAARVAGQTAGQVRVVGLARLTSPPDSFTPANDPVRNIWYRRDVAALDRSAFPDGSITSVPFVIEAANAPVAGGLPKGGVTRLAIPNRHLEYALTWWGLAGTLLGVFAVFAWGRWRAARA